MYLYIQHSHTRWGALAGHTVYLLAIDGRLLLHNPQLPPNIAKEICVEVVLTLVVVLVVR